MRACAHVRVHVSRPQMCPLTEVCVILTLQPSCKHFFGRAWVIRVARFYKGDHDPFKGCFSHACKTGQNIPHKCGNYERLGELILILTTAMLKHISPQRVNQKKSLISVTETSSRCSCQGVFGKAFTPSC